jgi:5-(carboxyamino)imidazole ribonucleotide synthase
MQIGILGSGQLGMMLAQAGIRLGHSFAFYDTAASSCTSNLGSNTVGAFDDFQALRAFASTCDVITYEFENVPCEAAHFLNTLKPVFPPPRALEVSQDRLHEKEFLQSLGIGTPRFEPASSQAELAHACELLGLPCIAKTRRFGYDGKGQYRIESPADIPKAWQALQGVPLLVEGYVPFSRELSVLVTRHQNGDVAFYPLSYNVHLGGILHRSELPAPDTSSQLRSSALEAAYKVVDALGYVGTLAIELFEVRGEILANELAPRVHNSGHATIEGVPCSQFENHIRAVSGSPLGATDPTARAVMYNVIGSVPDLAKVKRLPNSFIHMYGKSPRPGRKLGHITLTNPSESEEQLVSELCLRCKQLP